MAINMIMVTTDSPEIRMRYVFASGSVFLVVRSAPVFLELYNVVKSTPTQRIQIAIIIPHYMQ